MADMLATGIVIVLSFFMLARWLPVVTLLRLLGKPFVVDLAVTITVFVLYGGTGAGLAAATFAAFVMSVLLTFSRRLFGYISNGRYYRGRISLDDKIKQELNS